MSVLTAIVLMIISVFPTSCGLLAAPVDGPVVRAFAPQGRFGGHWGVDLTVAVGTPVAAADDGVVTFAGDVAGVASVTVNHGGGLRTSYSYLSAVDVTMGDSVLRGGLIGHSGVDHGLAVLHFSVRVGDRYVDPVLLLGCVSPGAGLRLVAGGRPVYA